MKANESFFFTLGYLCSVAGPLATIGAGGEDASSPDWDPRFFCWTDEGDFWRMTLILDDNGSPHVLLRAGKEETPADMQMHYSIVGFCEMNDINYEIESDEEPQGAS